MLVLSYCIVLEHPISFATVCIAASDSSGISTRVVNWQTYKVSIPSQRMRKPHLLPQNSSLSVVDPCVVTPMTAGTLIRMAIHCRTLDPLLC